VVQPEQPLALLNTIRRLASDPPDRCRLGRIGADYAKACLSPAETTRAFEQVLEGVLSGSARAGVGG
jgi:hypothetical protein